jgi:hypothetical protein
VQYIHVGVLLISVPNLVVICLLLIIFLIAVSFRFPQKRNVDTKIVEAHVEDISEDLQEKHS